MDILSVLLHQRSRKIGIIIPDVVISEKHSDVLEITEHPVERVTSEAAGASADGAGFVADHAYRRASELVMEIGFSGGGSVLDLLNTSAIGLSLGSSPKEIYAQLLDLQRSRQPFDVVTGKRLYSNMLIRVLDVTTDKTTENVLMATLTLREVITTQAKTITGAPKENMKLGANTSAVQDSGFKTPKQPSESILRSAFSAAKGIFS
ncbi:phage baseplate protein [Pantoea ananatis]